MRWHKACKDCVMSNDNCLSQENDDVESCSDVMDYDTEKSRKKRAEEK